MKWLERWIAFVLGAIVGLAVGMLLSKPFEQPVGRACYHDQVVQPFSNAADTADITICFRTPAP